MKVLLVGSGGREHALATVLSRTADVVVSPGNPGMETTSSEGHTVTCTPAPPEEIDADLVVIGPESPLVDGLADRLRHLGRAVFGPGAAGARLEGSKAFMKQVAHDAGVPTADFAVFDAPGEALAYLRRLPRPYVIKTDGLAAGKGVLVTHDLEEAESDLLAKLSGVAFGDSGRRVVIEAPLVGPEVSLLVLTDGTRAVALPPAQDYKRVEDGDIGPNTGGMGAYSPVPVAGDDVVEDIMDRIVEPTLAALRRAAIEYRGVLYAGCMLTEDGPKLVEFNVRFGDPEAEVVLPRLAGDVTGLLAEVAAGRLRSTPVVLTDAAVAVVVSSPGYPTEPVTGAVIEGVDAAGTVSGVTVFHAGTGRNSAGSLVTAGGRVLVLTGMGPSLAAARDRAYEAAARVVFPGAHYRRDIAGFAGAEVLGSGVSR